MIAPTIQSILNEEDIMSISLKLTLGISSILSTIETSQEVFDIEVKLFNMYGAISFITGIYASLPSTINPQISPSLYLKIL